MEQTTFDLQFSAVRSAIIEREYEHLNEMQRKAVFHTQGPLLVLAGAGSGKTTVLINRIENILRFGEGYNYPYAQEGAMEEDLMFLRNYLRNPSEQDRMRAECLCAVNPARPWQILAITFTNKAAKEIQNRLRATVGDDFAADIWASTFHSCCVRILRRFSEKIGFDKSFTIYDTDDKKRVLKAVLKQKNLDEKIYDVRIIMSHISRAKDNLLTPDQYKKKYSDDYFCSVTADIYKEYQKRLKESNAMDFDDLIMKTVQLLEENPDVLEHYRHQFKYIMADEYQDTNHAQYMLISLLGGGYKNICVVGDDDQSIYKFRGATVTNILEFENEYQGAKTIRLEQNYRSTQNILSAANEVISNNAHRKGKTLWTSNGNGVKIRVHRSDNQESEAEYISESILDGITDGNKWGDYAILYRSHVLSNNIESAFKKNGIPYRIVSGLRFFDRAEVRDMLAYLWVVLNPADDLRLRRIINVPARKIGEKTVETAQALADKNNTYLFNIVSHASDYPELSRASSALTKFADMIKALRNFAFEKSLSDFYDYVMLLSGYEQMLTEKGDPESLGRLENIMELKSNISDFEQRNPEPTLEGFMEEVSLFTDIDKMDNNADAVVMMTMHSAKGLEFPNVFLCGMEEGVFPSFRSMDSQEDMEEERRLCYVAMTRAKKALTLTCAEHRMMYGQTRYSKPSPFIEEIPKEYTDSNIFAEKPDEFKRLENTANEYNRPKRSWEISGGFNKSGSKGAKISAVELKAGDQVDHKTFGHGMIVSCKPMGGDILLEIIFDKTGTKRLMANAAMQFMKKI